MSCWAKTAALLPRFSCALIGRELEKSPFPSKEMLMKHGGTAPPLHSLWDRELLSPNFPLGCREVFLQPSTSAEVTGKQREMNVPTVPAKGRRLPGHTLQPLLQRCRVARSTRARPRLRDIATCLSDVLDEHTNLPLPAPAKLCVPSSSRDSLHPLFWAAPSGSSLSLLKEKKLAVKKSSLPECNEKLLTSNSCDTDHQKLAFLKFLLSTLC